MSTIDEEGKTTDHWTIREFFNNPSGKSMIKALYLQYITNLQSNTPTTVDFLDELSTLGIHNIKPDELFESNLTYIINGIDNNIVLSAEYYEDKNIRNKINNNAREEFLKKAKQATDILSNSISPTNEEKKIIAEVVSALNKAIYNAINQTSENTLYSIENQQYFNSLSTKYKATVKEEERKQSKTKERKISILERFRKKVASIWDGFLNTIGIKTTEPNNTLNSTHKETHISNRV